MMDGRALEVGGMTERDSRQYLAWSNSLTRTLRELGLKAAAPKAPSLQDYLASKAAAKAQPRSPMPKNKKPGRVPLGRARRNIFSPGKNRAPGPA